MNLRPRSTIVYAMLLVLAKSNVVLRNFKAWKTNELSFVRFILSLSKDPEYVFRKLAKHTRNLPDGYIASMSSCSIHSVICHSILDHYILTIKSFFLTSNIKVRVVAHDDGSLTEDDIHRLERELPGIKILRYSYTSRIIKRVLRNYPLLRLYRLATHPNKINIITTVDIPYFSQSEKILYLDGDILFFKPPRAITDWITKVNNTQELLYMKDHVNAYVLPEKMLQKMFGKGYIPKLNMGIFCYWKRSFNLPEVNTYFSILHSMGKDWIMVRDQTYWMIHAQKYYKKFKQLGDNYIVSFAAPRTAETVSFHYTSEIRQKIYTAGTELLFSFNLL